MSSQEDYSDFELEPEAQKMTKNFQDFQLPISLLITV
jgi:hypothetical protein